MLKNKRGVELSFAWIFSLIVGAAILFIAIYFASQLVDSESNKLNTQTAKEISNLLDPLQTSVEEGKSASIEIKTETRIYTSCNEYGIFGNTKIETAEKLGLKNEWSDRGGDISSQNSYLFAEEVIEGKKFYYFIKPFNMPFKIADMIMIYSDSYCFVSAPLEIKDEIENLGQNIVLVDSLSACENSMKSVCFSSTGCEINVNLISGIVRKDNKEIYFTEDLIYPAIFASKENYECNVKRLVKRLEQISKIYADKARLMSNRCNTGMYSDMLELVNKANNFENMLELNQLTELAEDIDDKNGELGCKLF